VSFVEGEATFVLALMILHDFLVLFFVLSIGYLTVMIFMVRLVGRQSHFIMQCLNCMINF
jgi:hypothetical protein